MKNIYVRILILLALGVLFCFWIYVYLDFCAMQGM